MRAPKLFLVIMMVFPSSLLAQASNVYLTPSGNATGNCPAGTSAAPNLTPAGFNNSSNWGSGAGKIGPGTVVLLCGTFSYGSSQGTVLTFQGGGSSGSPITLRFDSGASLQAQSWSAPAITSSNHNYITVDGGTNGLIEATQNGGSGATCPAGACTLQTDNGTCLSISSSTNITVQNLSCGPIYVHYCPSGVEANCSDEGGSDTAGLNFSSDNTLLVTGNTCQGAWACINYDWSGTASNVTISNNSIFFSNIGIQVTGGNSKAVLNTLIVNGNTIHDGANWSDKANGNHHDGMHLFSVVSGNQINGLQVYDNFIYGDWGDGVNAWIFLEANGGGAINSPYVYNNILEDDTTVSHAGNGFISVDGSGAVIVNNTMNGNANSSSCLLWTGANARVENNICMGITGGQAVVPKSTTGLTMDYNVYYNDNSSGWNNGSFSSWQSSCSCDAHSSNGTNPNLAGGSGAAAAYKATSKSTVLIGKGVNLTSLGNSGLDIDYAGLTRSASANWDIGSYAVNGSPSVAAPTNLAATVNVN